MLYKIIHRLGKFLLSSLKKSLYLEAFEKDS